MLGRGKMDSMPEMQHRGVIYQISNEDFRSFDTVLFLI